MSWLLATKRRRPDRRATFVRHPLQRRTVTTTMRMLVLLFLFLFFLMIRTRQLALRMSEISATFHQMEIIEARSHLSPPLPAVVVRPTTTGGDDHDKTTTHDFLEMVEELDGMTESLRRLLSAALQNHHHHAKDDDDDDDDIIAQRCRRYGLQVLSSIDGRPHRRRRRIFAGSLIADDSWHTIGHMALEYQDMFHTLAFVESNITQSGATRTLRFTNTAADNNNNSQKRHELLTSTKLWGHTTQVHVDTFTPTDSTLNGLGRENAQRNAILQRWKKNGMQPEDIGFLSDVDEIATRDFLWALQTCDIPEFRSPPTGHDCIQPKLSSVTLVYEGSPHCLQMPRHIARPDFILGECLVGIGNATEHPPVPRRKVSSSAERVPHWKSLVGNVTVTDPHNNPHQHQTRYIKGPLWDATDMRMITTRAIPGTNSFGIPKHLHTGVHLHNFFDSLAVLRHKYETYGHPRQGAATLPLADIQPNDVGFMVDCLTRTPRTTTTAAAAAVHNTTSKSKWRHYDPVKDRMLIDDVHGRLQGFSVPGYVELRHKEWQEELAHDQALHGGGGGIIRS